MKTAIRAFIGRKQPTLDQVRALDIKTQRLKSASCETLYHKPADPSRSTNELRHGRIDRTPRIGAVEIEIKVILPFRNNARTQHFSHSGAGNTCCGLDVDRL